MVNEQLLVDALLKEAIAANNEYWIRKINKTDFQNIHIAIMVEPYLSLILSGNKTMESRFSRNRCSPWNKIKQGDIVILKKSGGAFVAVFEASNVIFREIYNDIESIKLQYNDKLQIEDDFWNDKANSKFASLISISNLFQFEPFYLKFINRQAWIDFHSDSFKGKNMSNTLQPMIICITGRIGSGKTTVGQALAKELCCNQHSISNFLKHSLENHGNLYPSRNDLQDEGEKYIKYGWNRFCHDFLKFISWDRSQPVVIDGIRHIEFIKTLSIFAFPLPVYVVYLSAGEDTVARNIQIRGYETINSNRLAEGNLGKIKELSNVAICADARSIEEIVAEIIKNLFTSQVHTSINDETLSMLELKEYLDLFNLKRGWKKYHNAMDLAISINLEASELLEIFQWASKDVDSVIYQKMNQIKDELADILIYSFDLANAYGLDISSIILEKVKKNAMKYPEKN